MSALPYVLTALGGLWVGVALTLSLVHVYRARHGTRQLKMRRRRGGREEGMPALPPIGLRRPELVAVREPVDLFSLVPVEGRA